MSKTRTNPRMRPVAPRRLFEITPDLVCVVGPDGLLRHANPAWEKSVGPAPRKSRSRPFADFLHPEDHLPFEAALRELASGAPSTSFQARLRDGHARPKEFSWRLTACPEDRSILVIGREADDRFRLAVEAAPNAMMIVAPGGKIVLVNAEAEKLFGYSREELLNLPVDALVPERFLPKHSSSCAEYFGTPGIRAMGAGRDLWGLRKDGREVPIEIGLNPMATREGTFVMASLIDITERKRAEEKLRKELIRDPLTGLYNRRYLEETLDREIHRCARKKAPLGLVFMDVDRFKRFNDTFGHAAGDTVLREVGRLLRAGTRHGDIACRYGGEEFVLVLPETGPDHARMRAEELCRKAGQIRVKKDGRSLGRITLSMGVASFPEHGSSPHEILKAADQALYRAKRKGRNRVILMD